MSTEELTAAMFTKIEVGLATLNENVKNLTNELARLATLPDRMARTETKLEEGEKQAAIMRWILGLLMVGLGIAASHISWK